MVTLWIGSHKKVSTIDIFSVSMWSLVPKTCLRFSFVSKKRTKLFWARTFFGNVLKTRPSYPTYFLVYSLLTKKLKIKCICLTTRPDCIFTSRQQCVQMRQEQLFGPPVGRRAQIALQSLCRGRYIHRPDIYHGHADITIINRGSLHTYVLI